MIVTLLQSILSVISGLLVGFSLGLIGGGGSILAIPLFIYFVGINEPHKAIGTTALAVGINAFINFYQHAKDKNVNFRVGAIFALIGLVGVFIGSEVGLYLPGKSLLALFAVLMVVIGLYMYVSKCKTLPDQNCKSLKTIKKKKLVLYSSLVGFASGFFGIGGGFLIVPGIMSSVKIKINQAIGTSLFVVGTFGIGTAIRYAFAGDVLPELSILFIIRGILGGYFGTRISVKMDKNLLRKIFAAIVIIFGIYIFLESAIF